MIISHFISMETSVPSYGNRSYFIEQLAKGQQYFDPFAVLGIGPDDIFLASIWLSGAL